MAQAPHSTHPQVSQPNPEPSERPGRIAPWEDSPYKYSPSVSLLLLSIALSSCVAPPRTVKVSPRAWANPHGWAKSERVLAASGGRRLVSLPCAVVDAARISSGNHGLTSVLEIAA